MLVKDLMSSSVICAGPADKYDDIAFIMKSEDIGIVPVCDPPGHVIGVITDRDMVTRRENGPLAADLMSSPAITVNSGDDVHQAALKFSKYGIRRLPVEESGRIIGMLSLRDLARKKLLMAEIGHVIYNICNS